MVHCVAIISCFVEKVAIVVRCDTIEDGGAAVKLRGVERSFRDSRLVETGKMNATVPPNMVTGVEGRVIVVVDGGCVKDCSSYSVYFLHLWGGGEGVW